MFIALTALFFHVLVIHGATWDGVGAAWMLALLADVAMVAGILHTVAQ